MPVPAIIAGAAAVAGRLATKKVAKTVAKKVQSQAVKQNKKTVEKVARMQEKTKAEKIAKNSVKTKSANKSNPSNAMLNQGREVMTSKIKSGQYAKQEAKMVEASNKFLNQINKTKPKVVQVNSAAKAKSPDAAKSANAKALKAANKKGKK
jgi:glutaminase